MLDKSVSKLLNEQINKEFFSAYLYIDMADYYENQNLAGFANWFVVQAQEERDHAMFFRQYLLNNGEKVTLAAIESPTIAYQNFREPLVKSYDHECFVTASIHTIYDQALKVKDFRTVQFLDWFVREQGEEEKNSDDNIKKYDLFGGDPKSLFMLDNEMKARIYAPPTLVL